LREFKFSVPDFTQIMGPGFFSSQQLIHYTCFWTVSAVCGKSGNI